MCFLLICYSACRSELCQRFFKIKNVWNIKNVKNVKNVTKMKKNVKNVFTAMQKSGATLVCQILTDFLKKW